MNIISLQIGLGKQTQKLGIAKFHNNICKLVTCRTNYTNLVFHINALFSFIISYQLLFIPLANLFWLYIFARLYTFMTDIVTLCIFNVV